MVYYPQSMVDTFNNAITCLYVLVGLLFIVVVLAFIGAVAPEPVQKLKRKIKLFLGLDKVVRTVYTDKSKNYSGTEFLPIPVKAPTESFSYEFLGWNKFAMDKNGKLSVQPIYLKKVKTCIINVYDENDKILETHEVEYGAGIVLRHKIIKKESSKEFDYEFIGWDKETKAFFENTEIRPMFKANPIKYNYKFVLDDGETVVLEKTSISGIPIICPSDPAKVDNEFIYEFVEWKGYRRGMVLDKNYVFEAVFNKKVALNKEEKIKNEKNAIEVLVNEYKPKIKKSEKHMFQDNEKFAPAKKIEVEKNDNSKNIKLKEEKSATKSNKTLLEGVIVEKNKKSNKSSKK